MNTLFVLYSDQATRIDVVYPPDFFLLITTLLTAGFLWYFQARSFGTGRTEGKKIFSIDSRPGHRAGRILLDPKSTKDKTTMELFYKKYPEAKEVGFIPPWRCSLMYYFFILAFVLMQVFPFIIINNI